MESYSKEKFEETSQKWRKQDGVKNLRQRRKTKPDQKFAADPHTISTEQQTDYGEAQGLDEEQPPLGQISTDNVSERKIVPRGGKIVRRIIAFPWDGDTNNTAILTGLEPSNTFKFNYRYGSDSVGRSSNLWGRELLTPGIFRAEGEDKFDLEQPPLGQISTDNVTTDYTISTEQQTDNEQSEGALDEEQPPLGQISTGNVSKRKINIEPSNTISTEQQTDYEQGALEEEQPPLGQISTENISADYTISTEQQTDCEQPKGALDEELPPLRQINKERIFVAINFLIEISALTFDQISSKHKPIYALMVMLMSFVATLVSIIELAYKAREERVVWRWEKSKLPWFYHPSPRNKRFGTFPEIVGLVCAILQGIVSAIVYGLYLHHADYPIKISFWPIIFSLGLLCSKFMENQDRNSQA